MGRRDRFGNEMDEMVGFAWGDIIKGPIQLNYKALYAQDVIKKRFDEKGIAGLFNVTGLSEYFPILPEEIDTACLEFIGPIFFMERLQKLAMERVGGDAQKHDVAFFNRATAAGICSILTCGARGSKLLSLTPLPRSHPHIMKGAELAGMETIEVFDLGEYKAALERENVSMVVITSVSPHIRALPTEDIEEAITLARPVVPTIALDDASGHGWRPAIFGGPKSLEFDVDLAWCCLEKGNVYGPRVGLLAGTKELVDKVSALGGLIGCEMRA
ncbi:MAG: hypothetical protein ACE5JL_05520, partial [Dehalococcoidia bacterium]